MNAEDFRYALQNLMHRKLRSWLTVLSILIGIMAIFAIISFGLGIRSYMNTLASEAGTNKLYIQSAGMGAPGTDTTFSLSQEDIDFIGKINGVSEIAGMYAKAVQIDSGKEKKYAYLIGMDMDKAGFILEALGTDIISGRQLRTGDDNKVALGYNYQFDNKFFKKHVSVGDKVEINEVKFDVIGFYEEVGNPSDDSQIYMTSAAFESIYPEDKDKFGYVMASAATGVDVEKLADTIKEKLRKHKGQEEGKETFYVMTFADALQTFGTIINILNGILILIALISLVVASVNIMNTMYTAVLERTREIGVMKAIGARNWDILSMFIFESGLLGAVGGVIGVILGYIAARIGGAIAAGAGYALLKPVFPWYLTLGCILFAFFVGAISGVLPAINASRQKPVDALRYE
jgi:putative ABC transport system permease protein